MPTLVQHPLGSMLASRQLVQVAEVEQCLEQARERNCDLEEILIERGLFSEPQLLEILENHTFCPAVDVSKVEIEAAVLATLPKEVAKRHRALPLSLAGDRLRVALATPDDATCLNAVSTAAHKEVVAHVGLGFQIEQAIDHHYGGFEAQLEELIDESRGDKPMSPAPRRKASPKPAKREPTGRGLAVNPRLGVAKKLENEKDPVKITEALLQAAVELGATDLHLQPQEDGFYARLRIDGMLENVVCLPLELAPSVVSRLKILSDMDIAEHRRPQDGRARFDTEGSAVDLRVSCMPSQWGTKAVIRLLRRDLELLDIDRIQMPPAVREAFQEAIESPLGFYLVTGPTGSGKTTTLYATLQALDRDTANISTLEDPIEYSLEGITQMQVREDIGFDFAEGLRAMLRQDPDVLLVGEIRDAETVEVACRAALTGHKVFSTLHTNDACQAITRLLDMGAPPYLITATLKGVLAQRLVRVICGDCKEQVEMTEFERMVLGYPSDTHVHRGAGCDECGGSGYRGRMAVFEYFKMDETIHRLIQDRASPFAIRYAAQRDGMLLLSDFARKAVLDGYTTVAEIQRTILSEEAQEQLCTNCQRVVDLEFTMCPFCNTTLKESCSSCSRPVESSWESCAHCGTTIEREWQKLFCRSCLAPVQPHWTSCEYCNTELPS